MADDPNDSGLEGRPLTSGEIAIARPIFGDSIDYTDVLVFEGKESDIAAASAIGSNIFFPTETYFDDYSGAGVLRSEAATFLHEMTHVWQDQNGVDIEASQIEALQKTSGDYLAIYDYTLRPGAEFLDYNIEQQARIVQDYYLLDQGLPPRSEFPAPLATPTAEDYLDILRFDEPAEEAPENIARPPEPTIRPINEDGSPIDGGQVAPPVEPTIRPINEDGSPIDAEQPAPPANPEPTIRPINEDGSPIEPAPAQTGPSLSAPEPTVTPVLEPAEEAPSEPSLDTGPSEPGPTLGELTGSDGPPNGDDGIPVEDDEPAFDDRSADEIAEEMEAALRGETTDQDDDSETDDGAGAPEDEEEPETGGSSETPNPIDDPSPGNGDISVLVNRNAPAVNPGSGDFDLAGVDGDIFDLLDRNAPAVNPGSGDFDMPIVVGDLSDLLDRNAPAVNPGLGDFDVAGVGGDLSDLLDRNGPRQTFEVADTDLASSTVGDRLLSDLDLGASFDDFAAFDIV